MPSTPVDAPSAEQKQKLLAALPDVPNTGPRLLNSEIREAYRVTLRGLATPTSSWLGVITAQPNQMEFVPSGCDPANRYLPMIWYDRFFPLIAIDTPEQIVLPDEDRGTLGRIQGGTLLHGAARVHQALLTQMSGSMSTDIRSEGAILLIALVQALAVPADCPFEQRQTAPCSGCAQWMDCATGRYPFATMRLVHIDQYHFDKSARYGKGVIHGGQWLPAGKSVPSLSFRAFTTGPRSGAHRLTPEELVAVPQFEARLHSP